MKYRKNQIEVKIEGIQFKRDEFEDIREFTDGNAINFRTEKCINGKSYCEIKTLEGTITAVEDDYIIKDVNGDFFTCKPDIFKIEIPNGEKTIEMNVKCDNVIIKDQDDK